MKKLGFILLSVCLSVAGSYAQQKAIGGAKDSHGCMTAAGYTWSKIQKDCVRPSEQKIKLNEVNPHNSYRTFAAVIISRNRKTAEVFVPGKKESVLLYKKGNASVYTAKKGGYQLYTGRKTMLHVNGVMKFSN